MVYDSKQYRVNKPHRFFGISSMNFLLDSKIHRKIVLPFEILPTVNDPLAQHVDHVYLDFLPRKNPMHSKAIIGYQVSYEQSDSTFLRLFGSFIPQPMKQFTCSLYSYSYINKQFVKEDTSEFLFNFPKKFDQELKHKSREDSIIYSDPDDHMTIIYHSKIDCLTIKQVNLMFGLAVHEKRKENFLGYDLQLTSIHIRLLSNEQQLLICGLKSNNNKLICFLFDLHTLENLDTYSCSIGQNIHQILDVIIVNNQLIVVCFQTIDQRLFMWIGKDYFEEIAFSGIELAERKCSIDRLALSEHMDMLIAYRNIEQDDTRTCFAVSKYLLPNFDN